MRTSDLIGIAALALVSAAPAPADHLIHQKGRTFSESAITVARGEAVVFANDDNVPHNIVSNTPGNAFDLGSQMPGRATSVSFDLAGTVVVMCAIHPPMQMTITVTQ